MIRLADIDLTNRARVLNLKNPVSTKEPVPLGYGDSRYALQTFTVNGHDLSGPLEIIASEVPVAPTGGLSSTNVQAALEELQGDVNATDLSLHSVTELNDVTDAGSGAIITTEERDKLNDITITQPVDLDTLESNVAINNAKETNVTTDLSIDNITNISLDILSSDGTDVTIPEATTATAGLLTGTDKTKLNTIEEGAEVNVKADWNSTTGDAEILNKPTDLTDLSIHSITELNDVTSVGSGNIITTVERTKLNTIEEGAEVNVNADWDATAGDAEILNKPTDLTDLSTHSVEELSDIASVGSGNIITTIERNKLNTIEEGAEVNQSDSDIKTQYENNANTNAFTDSEKSKLASLESSKFLGTYTSESALTTTHPSPAEGSYAHVDSGVGDKVNLYIWDMSDSEWQDKGESGDETAEAIKTKYESNPDTNVFTDSEKTKLGTISTGAEANVNADWNSTTGDSQILNKPTDVTDLSTHSATELNDITSVGSGNIISSIERTKLNTIEEGAEVNVNADWDATAGDAEILNKPTDVTDLSTHSVTELNDITDAGSGNIITTTERSKLNDITITQPVDLDTLESDVAINNTKETNTITDLSIDNITNVSLDVLSSDGTDATIPAATEIKAGLLTGTDKTKLNTIEEGAQVNVNADWNATTGDSQILNKPTDVTDLSTHSATELNDITSVGSGKIISSIERTKLNTIEEGAEVNTVSSVNGETGLVDLKHYKCDDLVTLTNLLSGKTGNILIELTKNIDLPTTTFTINENLENIWIRNYDFNISTGSKVIFAASNNCTISILSGMSMSGMGSCNIQLDSIGFSMILRLQRFYAYSSSFTKTVGTTGTVLIEYASGYSLPYGGTLDNFDFKSTWLNPGIESKLLAESITETSSIANASKFFFSLAGLKQITWTNFKNILNSLYQSVLVSGTNIKTINSESILGAGNIDLVKGPGTSTDNAIARFDDTTGKVVQNSPATLDDDGNIAGLKDTSTETVTIDSAVQMSYDETNEELKFTFL